MTANICWPYNEGMAENLSKNQFSLLRQLCIYRQEHGASPSLRELANLAKVSDVKSAYRIVEKLEKAGFVEKEKNKSRSLKLTDRGMEAIGLSSFSPINLETIPSLYSHESLAQAGKTLETNGTYSQEYLRKMTKSEISAMGVRSNGTSSQGQSPKDLIVQSFTGAIYQLAHKEEYIGILGWVVIMLLLTWGSTAIVGNNITALGYAVALALLIKGFLK